MKFSEELWHENGEHFRRCTVHPFLTGIVNGDLELDCFKEYIAQDAYFLELFAKAYSALASRALEWSNFLRLHALVQGVVEERQLHNEYARRWSVDLSNFKPLPSTIAYTNLIFGYLDRFPGSLSPLACMLPCMKLYLELARWVTEQESYQAESNP
mmetsp:Transcript_1605/g.5785  ORF Transcript_1605/g.5785 Transcript_1605/m.5785 type:complete len:156 (-) Transcript_1605:2013-2480(-)